MVKLAFKFVILENVKVVASNFIGKNVNCMLNELRYERMQCRLISKITLTCKIKLDSILNTYYKI